jgi:hypothetical protein
VDKVEDDIVDPGAGAPVDETPTPAEEPAALDHFKETETPDELKETETLKEVKETKEAKKPVDIFADEKKTDLTPLLLIAAVFGLAVILLVIAWAGYLAYATAIYVAGLVFIPLLLWLGRKTNTVYVVFLGCAIAVLMTCVYFFWTVWGRYNFDTKATEAKERVGMVQPADRDWHMAIPADAIRTFGEC